MIKPKPQILLVIGLLICGSIVWYIDQQRDQQRSVLSGFFENQPTEVSSRIGGRINKILVNEGDTVQRGQVIMTIDAAPDQSLEQAKKAAAEQAYSAWQESVKGPRSEDLQKQVAAVAEAKAELASLSDGPRPEDVAEAKAAASAAQARYAEALRGPTGEEKAEAKARYDSAVASEVLAEKDFERYSGLYTAEAVTKQQYDQAQATLAEAKANEQDAQETWQRSNRGTPGDELEDAKQSYLQAKSALDLVIAGSRQEDIDAAAAKLQQQQAELDELRDGSRPEDIAQAKAAYEQAEALLASSRINLADRSVTTPFDAVIDSIPVSPGDLVTTTTTLARIENISDIWIKVYVPEAALDSVSVGKDAVLKVDGIPGITSAYVESISAHGEFTPANLQSPDERGKQVFAVRLRLKQPDSRIKAGMDATVVKIGNWTP